VLKERENTKAVHVWLVLWKAYRAVFEAANNSIKHLCLGGSDFRVLEVLLHKGPLPVNTIGSKVELTPGSISVAVDRLEKRGLVTRRMDPADRRVHVVHLTAEGEDVIRKAFAHHEGEMENLMKSLSLQERKSLIALLKKLGKSVQAAP
jgi:MarR family transcriptional regulator, 2-MHQ and catechol-resistance regulon repressor